MNKRMIKHVVRLQEAPANILVEDEKGFVTDMGFYMQSTGSVPTYEWVGMTVADHFHAPHIPEQVIYNGITTIAIFPDGKKIKARPDKGAKFDKETGLAMCIAKHIFGSRAAFLHAVESANDQNKVVDL